MTEPSPPFDPEAADHPAYEIGFKRPPKETRFKTGNTFGKGRRKGSKNLKTIVREALDAKVTVKVNGITRKLSKIELTLHQLANKASSGDIKAITMAIEAYERHGPIEDDATISDEEAAYDLATLRHHLMMKGEIDFE